MAPTKKKKTRLFVWQAASERLPPRGAGPRVRAPGEGVRLTLQCRLRRSRPGVRLFGGGVGLGRPRPRGVRS